MQNFRISAGSPQAMLADLAAALRADERALIDIAGKVVDTRLVRLFYQLAGEREILRGQLGSVASPQPRHKAGALEEQLRSIHAQWPGAVSNGDVYQLLNDVERAELAIIQCYDSLLQSSVAEQSLLAEQRRVMVDSQRLIRRLREQHNPFARPRYVAGLGAPIPAASSVSIADAACFQARRQDV